MRGICSNERAAITHQRLNAWSLSLSLSLSGSLVSRDISVCAKISDEGSRRIKLLFIIRNCRWRKRGDRRRGKNASTSNVSILLHGGTIESVFHELYIVLWKTVMSFALFTHRVIHSRILESWRMTNSISYSGEFSIIIVHVKWRINGHRRSGQWSVGSVMVVERYPLPPKIGWHNLVYGSAK